MPWVAVLALIGTLSIAGLAAAQRLRFRVAAVAVLSYLLRRFPHAFINMLIPLGAAALALTVALAAYVMVKFYGVIFLGQPREASLVDAHDANWLERLGLGWLAFGMHPDRRAAAACTACGGYGHRQAAGPDVSPSSLSGGLRRSRRSRLPTAALSYLPGSRRRR